MTDGRTPVLGALGDLVEDIRVHLTGPINVATDTDARITRTRGGSAANVAVAAAAIEGRARFIGQVGNDAVGAAMVASLAAAGVEIAGHRGGRTGTIVVLVDPDGERTMLSDRGSAHELTSPAPAWLDGLHTLHVPAYSLVREPLAAAAAALVTWAHDRGVTVSIDLSSTSVIEAYGPDPFVALVAGLSPTVLIGNEDEARMLGDRLGPIVDAGGTIVVHGSGEASARHGDVEASVSTEQIPGVGDTTGAGDVFAAAYLCARAASAGLAEALTAGHAAAGNHITASRAPR